MIYRGVIVLKLGTKRLIVYSTFSQTVSGYGLRLRLRILEQFHIASIR